jgi:peptidoglycan/xylan/chitin deacetylase (PgdA/CDA1 family)
LQSLRSFKAWLTQPAIWRIDIREIDGSNGSDSRQTPDFAGNINRARNLCLVSLGASSFLYATYVKSGAGVKNRPAEMEKIGGFGEVDRGPRGKNEIPLTFDAGAEAECFDDLITALAHAHASSTFFITGRFVHDHADCAAEITKHGHEVGNHTWSHLNHSENRRQPRLQIDLLDTR